MEYIIDAQGKKIGRVASQAAKILMGKTATDFARNKYPDLKVKITNVSRADVTNKKMITKEYKNYSGYPGGLKETTMKKLVADKGMKEVFRKAVYGMLPINKLRPRIIKNLVIEN
ncbi:MAG TPA: uL13 family ribosomal protein [Candidatus Paceibacterota bacterium]